MPSTSVSVIIPTYQAERTIPELLERLSGQTCPPAEIIVVDSSSDDRTAEFVSGAGCLMETIRKEDFSHGGARNLGVSLAKCEILVFMTQDALPFNSVFLETLIAPIVNEEAAASSARQVAGNHATPLETYARMKNYPAESRVYTMEAVRGKSGSRVLFSNVASAFNRAIFQEIGGFPEDLIVNEDMLISERLIKAGYAVSYQAEAVVEHTHNYGAVDMFRRYFDIGVFFSQVGAEMDRSSITGSGIEFAIGELRYLWKQGKWGLIPLSIFFSMEKFIAFRFGMNWKSLPHKLGKVLSRHPMVFLRLEIPKRQSGSISIKERFIPDHESTGSEDQKVK